MASCADDEKLAPCSPTLDEEQNAQSTRVYVGNVPFKATDAQLKRFLSRKFGGVRRSMIQWNKSRNFSNGRPESRGFAFVQFRSQSSAKKAIDAPPNELRFQGRGLQIKPARAKSYGAGVSFENYFTDKMQRLQVPVGFDPACYPEQVQTPLPLEILVGIFKLLPIGTLLACGQVCRQWYNAAMATWEVKTYLEFHCRSYGDPWQPLCTKYLHRFLSLTAGTLQEITIGRGNKLDKEALIVIAKGCPNLKALRLTDVVATSFALKCLSRRCPSLEYLALDGSFDESGLRSLLHVCPLKKLSLSNSPSLKGSSFSCLGSNSRLESISIKNCIYLVSAAVGTMLERCPNLLELNLGYWIFSNPSCIATISVSCPKLRALSLAGTSLGDHRETLRLGNMPCLLELDLSYNDGITDEIVVPVLRQLRGLRNLDLANCKGVTDVTAETIAQCCVDLQVLDISYIKNVTSAGLRCLAMSCRDLRTLRVRNCDFLDDDGLLNVGEHCEKLQDLNISACWCFSVDIISSLDEVRCDKLECPLLTVTAGGTLTAIKAPNLDHLKTVKCSYADTAHPAYVDHLDRYSFVSHLDELFDVGGGAFLLDEPPLDGAMFLDDHGFFFGDEDINEQGWIDHGNLDDILAEFEDLAADDWANDWHNVLHNHAENDEGGFDNQPAVQEENEEGDAWIAIDDELVDFGDELWDPVEIDEDEPFGVDNWPDVLEANENGGLQVVDDDWLEEDTWHSDDEEFACCSVATYDIGEHAVWDRVGDAANAPLLVHAGFTRASCRLAHRRQDQQPRATWRNWTVALALDLLGYTSGCVLMLAGEQYGSYQYQ